MKVLTLTSAFALVLHALACGATQRPAPPPQPTPEPTPPQSVILDQKGLPPETTAYMKDLLYSDRPLEKVLENVKPDRTGGDEDPWLHFERALAHSKQGKDEEARKELRRVLAMPDGETRVLLTAWTALRALGERPPPGEADKVRGVVCELLNEEGVGGTLAAYADGRARWFGSRGAGTFWEAPGDKEIDTLINDLLKTVEPLVKKAPASERRMPAEIERAHFRVTVLTFGGLHAVDVYGPDIDGEARYIAPTLMASVSLLDALLKRQPDKGQ